MASVYWSASNGAHDALRTFQEQGGDLDATMTATNTSLLQQAASTSKGLQEHTTTPTTAVNTPTNMQHQGQTSLRPPSHGGDTGGPAVSVSVLFL